MVEWNGSSPRGWGTHRDRSRRDPGERFIPTRVGNTFSIMRLAHARTVHPHAGGEHRDPVVPDAAHHGSSPRGWGTHPRKVARVLAERFIPTRVGNTLSRSSSCASSAVHPHAGGEHGKQIPHNRSGRGSSPRGWGTPIGYPIPYATQRFIPTRVGNTTPIPVSTAWTPVHPHAGGEHSHGTCGYPWAGGSSPRGWGTPSVTPSEAPTVRFIPTRVGNTRADARPTSRSPVHPHAGGEHLLIIA